MAFKFQEIATVAPLLRDDIVSLLLKVFPCFFSYLLHRIQVILEKIHLSTALTVDLIRSKTHIFFNLFKL